ncbi:hypothetical protein COHA_002292 [Chlorella ohadii]|uniref:Uncharacterized protein n=1 Tax=Chlorella ohadii TaxID=2649997 RepID=A0AAD5DTM9_9CHLO|nr:hypothetical protein COHA_002292 [Chlorella ohadii]
MQAGLRPYVQDENALAGLHRGAGGVKGGGLGGLASEAAAAAAAPASRADVLAEGGVERCFGRSWQQLERDRLAREDEESSRRLAALAAYSGRGLPNFFPLWGAAGSQAQVLQKDVLPSPPASPLAKQPLSAGLLADLSLPDTSNVALPDVPMSDSFPEDWD